MSLRCALLLLAAAVAAATAVPADVVFESPTPEPSKNRYGRQLSGILYAMLLVPHKPLPWHPVVLPLVSHKALGSMWHMPSFRHNTHR